MNELFKKPTIKRTISNFSSVSLNSGHGGNFSGLVKRRKPDPDLTSLEVISPELHCLRDYNYIGYSTFTPRGSQLILLVDSFCKLQTTSEQSKLPPLSPSSKSSCRATFEKYCDEKFDATTSSQYANFGSTVDSISCQLSELPIQVLETSHNSSISLDLSRQSLYIPKSKPPPTPKSSLDNWEGFLPLLESSNTPKKRFAPKNVLKVLTPKVRRLFKKFNGYVCNLKGDSLTSTSRGST
ncbi:uncharacterized protein CANTADRAFT_6301 [Suhomyces tanzawaensis NRRL Y-17324]|uniref:Uncharacterized protein n=1 Tax=Suhomyces tanzawaensis NRRL Y-17324 TaxID=984487 RepID=A0A1E4SHZ7_9ASCO|nr:uncharacterized protein CANTADRAFT_6301 [Suhomyces tanzawaensis NRRL Y-17324]ODV79126.1 hypothetical protein CANTADRAFT_6301 [Suhomyces tanzawaensis NRRL Y-17324]